MEEAFIDPPGDFAPASEWRRFLADMEAARGRLKSADEMIALAKKRIAEREDWEKRYGVIST